MEVEVEVEVEEVEVEVEVVAAAAAAVMEVGGMEEEVEEDILLHTPAVDYNRRRL